jgi:hypothetical protein
VNVCIFPQVLFPTEKITCSPLIGWARSLESKLLLFKNYKDILKETDHFATILNQIPLIVSFTGNTKLAARICMDVINFYSNLYSKTRENEILIQAIQPWINLGRLDRIENNYQEAIQKFIFLHTQDSTKICITFKGLSGIIAEAIQLLKGSHHETKTILDFCKIAEPAITLLKQKDYQALLACYPLVDRFSDAMSERLICECQIIALICLQKFIRARYYIKNVYKNISKNYFHLFLYRDTEIAYLTDEQLALKSCLFKLQHIQNRINIDSCNHNAINFVLAYANLLLRVDQFERASELINLCYQRYLLLNDEVGQIRTLNQLVLYSKVKSVEHQEKLQKLYQQTGYKFLLPAGIVSQFIGHEAIDSMVMQLERKLELLL